MRIPPFIIMIVLVLTTTAFYTLIGQMVPQKEVPAPEVMAISKDVSTQEMIEIGREIAEGKGICLTCHTIGRSGALRFPDLDGIGARAGSRIPGLSDVEYLAQSLYQPDVYVVEGFNPGMPIINKAPIGLTDDEILTVIAYLQSLGGTPNITMDARHAFNGGEGVVALQTTLVPGTGGEAMGASDGEVLFERFGCAACHATALSESEGPASPLGLHDVGTRLGRAEILAGIIDPATIKALSPEEEQLKREALQAAGVYATATLQEIQAIAEFLIARKGSQ